jgi:hypothetical protein
VHGDILNIDRVDLTRRMDAINTWVGDALHKGHDVVFVEGGSENVWYDENSKTLHLTVSDEYEISVLSNLFEKGKYGLKWCLENKDFDVLYTCDDDVYINLEQFLKIEITHDYMRLLKLAHHPLGLKHGSLWTQAITRIASRSSAEVAGSEDIQVKSTQ